VVVGGGNSAGYFCRALAAAKSKIEGGVAVLSAESVAPYERPALTKAYLHPPTAKVRARLPGFHTCVGGGGDRQLPEWYAENGIELRLDTKVTSIDVAKKVLETPQGPVSYQKLVVATGCDAAPGKLRGIANSEVGNVFTLRSEADAAKVVAALEAKPKNVVVVGGGYIGLEVAAAVLGWEIPTTVIVPEGQILNRVFPEPLSAWMQAQYEERGAKFLLSTTVKACKDEGGVVCGVELGDGTVLPADLVVLGLGSMPATEMFAGQLEMDRGAIVVDGCLRASVPDVFAVGDVAAFPHDGKPGRFEHVGCARSSAAHAAKTVLGSTEEYVYAPFFYSRVFEYTASPIVWNHFGAFGEAQAVTAGEGQVAVLYTDNGVVVGGVLAGSPSPAPEQFEKLKQIVAEKPAFAADLLSA